MKASARSFTTSTNSVCRTKLSADWPMQLGNLRSPQLLLGPHHLLSRWCDRCCTLTGPEVNSMASTGSYRRVLQGEFVRKMLRGTGGPRPLRHLLTTLVLIVALPILMLSAFVMWRLAQHDRRQHEQRLEQLASDLADDIDRQLHSMIGMLQALATTRALREGQFSEFHSQAREATAGRDWGVILLEPNARQLVNTYVDFGTPLPGSPDLGTLNRMLASSQPEVSNVFVGRITGRPALNVTYPVERDG